MKDMATEPCKDSTIWDEIKAIFGLFIGLLVFMGVCKLGVIFIAWFLCMTTLYCTP